VVRGLGGIPIGVLLVDVGLGIRREGLRFLMVRDGGQEASRSAEEQREVVAGLRKRASGAEEAAEEARSEAGRQVPPRPSILTP